MTVTCVCVCVGVGGGVNYSDTVSKEVALYSVVEVVRGGGGGGLYNSCDSLS